MQAQQRVKGWEVKELRWAVRFEDSSRPDGGRLGRLCSGVPMPSCRPGRASLVWGQEGTCASLCFWKVPLGAVWRVDQRRRGPLGRRRLTHWEVTGVQGAESLGRGSCTQILAVSFLFI